jgi:hypothetical protein
MPTDRPEKGTRLGTKSAGMRDAYRRMLRAPELKDQEIDEMRQHVTRLSQALCEHVWSMRFY